MKKIFLASLVAISTHASAANWFDFGTGSDFGMQLDTQSIAITPNGDRKAWSRWNYDSAKKMNGHEVRMVLSLEIYRCSERTSATIQQVFYPDYTQNNSVDQIVLSPSDYKFSDVVPETMGEKSLNFVCSWPVKKKP